MRQTKFSEIPLAEVFRVEVGSGLHGIAIEGTDDHDEMGVFIEPPESVFGWELIEHDVWRTQPEGHRSGPGDVDLVRYSLRKYLRLAVQGNPTILLPLFAPRARFSWVSRVGEELLNLRPQIVSRQAGPRFLGYMDSQIARFEGRKKMPTTRAELIEKYGFDTKFASHAARLGLQGISLLRTGEIALPMKGWQLETVRDIKTGKWSREQVVDYLAELRAELADQVLTPTDPLHLPRRVVAESPLPARPDLDLLTRWMKRVHIEAWS